MLSGDIEQSEDRMRTNIAATLALMVLLVSGGCGKEQVKSAEGESCAKTADCESGIAGSM